MKGGRKPTPPSAKILKGTFRLGRDSCTLEFPAPDDPPVMPDYLSPAAQAVWNENLEAVMSAGVCAYDSSFYARYCHLEAEVRGAFSRGEAVTGAMLSELRRYGELLCIAGPKSRTVRRGNGPNPFGSNGRRPTPPQQRS